VLRQVQEFEVIRNGEMRSDEAYGCEVDRPIGEPFQDRRKTLRRSGRFDTKIGGMLGETKHLNAEREERRATLLRVQRACVNFHEQRNDVCRGVVFVTDGRLELCQQLMVGELGD
jgi:hypothetical protein